MLLFLVRPFYTVRERRKVAGEYIDVLKKLGVLKERGGVFGVNEERLNRVLWLAPRDILRRMMMRP